MVIYRPHIASYLKLLSTFACHMSFVATLVEWSQFSPYPHNLFTTAFDGLLGLEGADSARGQQEDI